MQIYSNRIAGKPVKQYGCEEVCIKPITTNIWKKLIKVSAYDE